MGEASLNERLGACGSCSLPKGSAYLASLNFMLTKGAASGAPSLIALRFMLAVFCLFAVSIRFCLAWYFYAALISK